MHGFFPRRQDFEGNSRLINKYRKTHGKAPQAIGRRAIRPNPHLRSRGNTKVRLYKQSAAKIIASSHSYSKRRELITHGENWKLMLSNILTPITKNNHVRRRSQRIPAAAGRLDRSNPLVRPAEYDDGEISWGGTRAVNASNSTVLDDSRSSSSHNSSAGAEKIRQMMQKQRLATRKRKYSLHAAGNPI